MNELREIRLRKALRGLVLVVSALTIIAIVFGLLPGHERYVDGVLVERTLAGGPAFPQFALWLLAPGFVVWLHPRVGVALVWSVLGWIGTLMLFGLTGSGDGVTLWPATAVLWLMAPVIFTLLVGLPVGLATYQTVIRRADAREIALANPPLPTARVVSRRPLA